MKSRWLFVVVAGIFSITLATTAADWPQWRGPERNGISKEIGLLKEWPKEGPKLLWQVKDIGQGYSTPAVVGDRLYLLSNKGTGDEFVQAREVKDGKQAWSTRIGKVGNRAAHISLRREQRGRVGQDALMNAVVIFRACSRHRILSASNSAFARTPGQMHI